MKMDCDVIKDLLPLYYEEIVSEKSKALVEEHCKECMSCNNALQHMKENEIVIEDNGNRLKKFMKDWKKNFQALVAICCYTTLVLIGILHGKYGIGPIDSMGVIILYAMFLFPIVGLFSNIAVASQKLKIKYVFPVLCGLAGMCYQDFVLDNPIEIETIWFNINFIPALIGFVIGMIKSRNGLESQKKWNEGMLAGIVLAVFAITQIIYNPNSLGIMLVVCIGGILITVVSFVIKNKFTSS